MTCALPDLHVALVRPEIHPNTGNIARLCAANCVPLHIVGMPGFRLDERSVRRAGLDYWPHVDVRRENDLSGLSAASAGLTALLLQRARGAPLHGGQVRGRGLPGVRAGVARVA